MHLRDTFVQSTEVSLNCMYQYLFDYRHAFPSIQKHNQRNWSNIRLKNKQRKKQLSFYLCNLNLVLFLKDKNMNKLLTLTFMATFTLVSACSTTDKNETVQLEAAPDCLFQDGKTAAPMWVCGSPVEGYAASAVGSWAKSSAGQGFMKQQASAQARVELAQSIRTQVSNQIKQFSETTGAGLSETVDQVVSSVTNNITDESIMGSRILRHTNGPDGEIYVLVVVDEANLVAMSQEAIATSMNNDKALWQKVMADKAHKDFAKELDNYRKNL